MPLEAPSEHRNLTLTLTNNDGGKSTASMIASVTLPPLPRDVLVKMWWLLLIIIVLVVVILFLVYEQQKWKKRAQVPKAPRAGEGLKEKVENSSEEGNETAEDKFEQHA